MSKKKKKKKKEIKGERKKSQILFTVKKTKMIIFHPGWEAGGGVFVCCFCFFLGLCFSHVYSARSVGGASEKEVGLKRSRLGLTGSLRLSGKVRRAEP